MHIIQCNTIEQNTEINRHFIKEKLDSGLICILYVSIDRQLVDVLIKGLSRTKLQVGVSMLGMENIYSSAWGRVWKNGIGEVVIL